MVPSPEHNEILAFYWGFDLREGFKQKDPIAAWKACSTKDASK